MEAFLTSHSDDILIHSFECFFNSLLRELAPDCYLVGGSKDVITLKNKSGQELSVALEKFSTIGRHKLKVHERPVLSERPVSKREALKWLCSLALEKLGEASKSQEDEFFSRVLSSDHNMKEILRDANLKTQERLTFIASESSLFSGHTFHPYPKNRSGLEGESFKKYSPEYCSPFALAWCLAEPDVVISRSSKHFKNNWALEIFNGQLPQHSEHKELLPVHPWQLEKLRSLPAIQSLEEQNKISFITENKDVNWRATSSVRSLYNSAAPYMLKFSLSMRLTNSIRHLQEVEVVRGMQVHDVMNSSVGKKLQEKWPNFHILHEPAFKGLKDPKTNKIIVESIVVCRQNILREHGEDNIAMLAGLNQQSPDASSYYLDKICDFSKISSEIWFKRFIDIALAPLLDYQANFGIYLGAHQQNLLLKLDSQGLPSGLLFRDCQGTGYSELGYETFKAECSSLERENGNILTSEMGRMLFCYYLFINSTFNTIATLSQITGQSEKLYLGILRESLNTLLKQGVKDESTLRYLLESEELWQKGNFGCCLRDINENTIRNPMSIYNKIPNPLREEVLS